MGVTKETIKKGDEENYPKKGDEVTVHYSGKLASNNKQFDSSLPRNEPFSFTIGVGQVIKGWDEGVIQMSIGEKAILKISADFGYGAAGAGRDIPPNSELIFEVELFLINGVGAREEGLARCSSCLKREGNDVAFSRCGACLSVYYCNRDCQKKDWRVHKKHCKNLKEKTAQKSE